MIILHYLSMRIEYEAVLFTNIRQSESEQVNIAQMEKDFRMYFRYFFFFFEDCGLIVNICRKITSRWDLDH